MFRKSKSKSKNKKKINWESIYGKMNDITKEEISCGSCGYTVRYEFFRCPQCSATRK